MLQNAFRVGDELIINAYKVVAVRPNCLSLIDCIVEPILQDTVFS